MINVYYVLFYAITCLCVRSTVEIPNENIITHLSNHAHTAILCIVHVRQSDVMHRHVIDTCIYTDE